MSDDMLFPKKISAPWPHRYSNAIQEFKHEACESGYMGSR
ncbi:predicted protein [Botrytis cinerea T4]|uniref:Uncharacterized protein n=1 Tax=Botryotinia fuckeliana (strain T4) TaxID=999810 RepID=G2XU18_BOTF4|nr:predicted protein [Botrytis cinerea T4]